MKYLKSLKKFLALTAAAVMLTFLPNANVLTASAEEPVTYYVMYDEEDEDWWYHLGSEWDEDAPSGSYEDLQKNIKNGDIVAVGNGSVSHALVLNVHLSNLTINNKTDILAMVNVTGGIDNCYFNRGTLGSITGSVTNAYVYGASLANFHNSVGNLYSYEVDSETAPTIGVAGTVSYFVAQRSDGSIRHSGTNFKAETFFLDEGILATDSDDYTQDISSGPASTAAQSTNTTQKTNSSTSSGEYDAVPKTGETSFVLWLCLAAAVSFSGSLLLRRLGK